MKWIRHEKAAKNQIVNVKKVITKNITVIVKLQKNNSKNLEAVSVYF